MIGYPSISLSRPGLGQICRSKGGGRAERTLEADMAIAAADWNGKRIRIEYPDWNT